MSNEQNKFVIYYFQFDKSFPEYSIKEFDTTCIGEINLNSTEYNGKSISEAVRKRIKKELSLNKSLSKESNNYLFNHISGLGYKEVQYSLKSHADTQIHKYLKNRLGYTAHKGAKRDTEFFDLGNHFSEIVNESINAVFNLDNSKIEFIVRDIQKRYIEKLVAYIKNAPKNNVDAKFLLAALCRFGKSAATLYALIHELGFKKILILSAKCDTKNSWYNDFCKWSFLEDYVFIDKNDLINNNKIFDLVDKCIAWMSLQSSAKEYEEEYEEDYEENFNISYKSESWQKIVANYDWDIVITDECHYGVDTKRSQGLINKILEKTKYKLEISATPFKKFARNEYTIENSFLYDLTDESIDFKNGCISKLEYVPIQLFHTDLFKYFKQNYDSGELRRCKGGTFAEKLNNMLLHCLIDQKFSFDAYFEQFDEDALRIHFKMLNDKFFSRNGKNSAIFVNKVKSGEKLANALKQLYGYDYKVYNLCGNSEDKRTVAQINRDMENAERNGGPGVIIISCGRYLTGVTLTYLHNMIFMGTVNSAENYIQFGCRPKNSYDGRVAKCCIYDLNPETILKTDSFKSLVAGQAVYLKKSNLEIVRKYQDALEIFELNDGNNLFKVDNFVEDFEKTMFLRKDGSFLCTEFLSKETLSNDDIQELTNNIKQTNNNQLEFTVTEPQIDKAKEISEKKSKNNSETENKKKESIEELLNRLQEKVVFIPSFLSYNKIESVDELLKNTKQWNYSFSLHCRDLELSILIKLKEIWRKNNNIIYWTNFCDGLISNKKYLDS